MKVTRREILQSTALLSAGALGITRIKQSSDALQNVSVRCTGVAINGGGLGEPLVFLVFLASDDKSFQATLTLESDEGFVDGRYYLISATPD